VVRTLPFDLAGRLDRRRRGVNASVGFRTFGIDPIPGSEIARDRRSPRYAGTRTHPLTALDGIRTLPHGSDAGSSKASNHRCMLDQIRFRRRRTSWLPANHSDRSLLLLYRKRIASWLFYVYITYIHTRTHPHPHMYVWVCVYVFSPAIISNARVQRMIHVSRSLSHSLCSRKKSVDVKHLLRYSGRVERVNVNGGHRHPLSYVIPDYPRYFLFSSASSSLALSIPSPRGERLLFGGMSNFVNMTYEEKRKRMCEDSPLLN